MAHRVVSAALRKFGRYRGIAEMARLAAGSTRSRMTQSRHTLADRSAACHGKGLGKLDGGACLGTREPRCSNHRAEQTISAAPTAPQSREATPPEMREVFPSPQRT
jgi:hypothetical protein